MVNKENFSIEKLVTFCKIHQLWFDLHYSEIENKWELELNGAGRGESYYTEGFSLEWVIDNIIQQTKTPNMQFQAILNTPEDPKSHEELKGESH